MARIQAETITQKAVVPGKVMNWKSVIPVLYRVPIPTANPATPRMAERRSFPAINCWIPVPVRASARAVSNTKLKTDMFFSPYLLISPLGGGKISVFNFSMFEVSVLKLEIYSLDSVLSPGGR